jgi:hypothetical protein
MIPFCLLVDAFVNSSSEFFHGKEFISSLSVDNSVDKFVFAGWKVHNALLLSFLCIFALFLVNE